MASSSINIILAIATGTTPIFNYGYFDFFGGLFPAFGVIIGGGFIWFGEIIIYTAILPIINLFRRPKIL